MTPTVMLIHRVLVAVYITGYSLIYFCLFKVLWPWLREVPKDNRHKNRQETYDCGNNHANYGHMERFLASVVVLLLNFAFASLLVSAAGLWKRKPVLCSAGQIGGVITIGLILIHLAIQTA